MVTPTLEMNILAHLGLYRLSTRSILSEWFLGGGCPDKIIRRLKDQGLIKSNRLSGAKAVYQLTKKSTAQLGITQARAGNFKAQATHMHLSLLMFCSAPDTHRMRLEDEQVHALFAGEPEGTHVTDSVNDNKVVYQTYAPSPRTSLNSVVRHVRRQIRSAQSDAVRMEFFGDGSYRIAVICDSELRKKSILTALRKPERDGKGPLIKQAKILVEAIKQW